MCVDAHGFRAHRTPCRRRSPVRIGDSRSSTPPESERNGSARIKKHPCLSRQIGALVIGLARSTDRRRVFPALNQGLFYDKVFGLHHRIPIAAAEAVARPANKRPNLKVRDVNPELRSPMDVPHAAQCLRCKTERIPLDAERAGGAAEHGIVKRCGAIVAGDDGILPSKQSECRSASRLRIRFRGDRGPLCQSPHRRRVRDLGNNGAP